MSSSKPDHGRKSLVVRLRLPSIYLQGYSSGQAKPWTQPTTAAGSSSTNQDFASNTPKRNQNHESEPSVERPSRRMPEAAGEQQFYPQPPYNIDFSGALLQPTTLATQNELLTGQLVNINAGRATARNTRASPATPVASTVPAVPPYSDLNMAATLAARALIPQRHPIPRQDFGSTAQQNTDKRFILEIRADSRVIRIPVRHSYGSGGPRSGQAVGFNAAARLQARIVPALPGDSSLRIDRGHTSFPGPPLGALRDPRVWAADPDEQLPRLTIDRGEGHEDPESREFEEGYEAIQAAKEYEEMRR